MREYSILRLSCPGLTLTTCCHLQVGQGTLQGNVSSDHCHGQSARVLICQLITNDCFSGSCVSSGYHTGKAGDQLRYLFCSKAPPPEPLPAEQQDDSIDQVELDCCKLQESLVSALQCSQEAGRGLALTSYPIALDAQEAGCEQSQDKGDELCGDLGHCTHSMHQHQALQQ